MNDPNLSYYGHPILPAGFDDWTINGTEFNAPGVNAQVWPDLFDSFIGLEVVIITEEMLDFFVTGCPDLVVAHVDNEVVMRGRMNAAVTPQPSKVRVAGETTVVTFPMVADTVQAAKPDNNAEMTRRGTRLPIRTKTTTMRLKR